MVVSSSNQRWVLVIDSIFGVHRFHESDLLDVPAASLRHSNEYIRGLIARGDQHFGLIDLARLCVGLEEQLT